jgi:hypothetical protein
MLEFASIIEFLNRNIESRWLFSFEGCKREDCKPKEFLARGK